MEARRWWYGLPEETRDGTPVPTKNSTNAGPQIGSCIPCGSSGFSSKRTQTSSCTRCRIFASYRRHRIPMKPDPRQAIPNRGLPPRFPPKTSRKAPAPASAPAEPTPPTPAQAGPPSASAEPPAAPPPTLEQRLRAAMQQGVPQEEIKLAISAGCRNWCRTWQWHSPVRSGWPRSSGLTTRSSSSPPICEVSAPKAFTPTPPSVFRHDWDRNQKTVRLHQNHKFAAQAIRHQRA